MFAATDQFALHIAASGYLEAIEAIELSALSRTAREETQLLRFYVRREINILGFAPRRYYLLLEPYHRQHRQTPSQWLGSGTAPRGGTAPPLAIPRRT